MIDSESSRAIRIERHYEPDEDAIREAVRILLDSRRAEVSEEVA